MSSCSDPYLNNLDTVATNTVQVHNLLDAGDRSARVQQERMRHGN